MLVEATAEFKKLNLGLKEIHRVPEPGERFEVDPYRFSELCAYNNKYNVVLIKQVSPLAEKVKAEEIIEPEIVEDFSEDDIPLEEPKKKCKKVSTSEE